MKRFNTLILFFFISQCSFSQLNLIPNSGFEKLIIKAKNVGELNKAVPWISPTQGTADIFSKHSKEEAIGVPKNTLGNQLPRTGDNYAGAIFYSKKGDNEREYLQTELGFPLDSGKIYCVEFYVSLADLSKYAIDRVGGHFSREKIHADSWDPLPVIPQIANKQEAFLADQSNWQLVCGEYTAKGGELYFTIGNFYPNAETKSNNMKKPSGIQGNQHLYSYYYIDDVSVIPLDSIGGTSCGCEKKLNAGKTENKMHVVYSKVVGEYEEKVLPEDILESKSIFFESQKTEVLPKSKTDLEMVVNVLKQNTGLKIEIIGYADPSETTIDALIAENRAKKIMEQIESKGVQKERMALGKGNLISVKESNDEKVKAGNRRVDFAVISE